MGLHKNMNYLTLEERGCPFFDCDNCSKYSDLKNYRLYTQLVICGIQYYFEICTHDHYRKQDFKNGRTGVITRVVASYDSKATGLTFCKTDCCKFIFPTKQAIIDYFNEYFDIKFDGIRIVKHKKWR